MTLGGACAGLLMVGLSQANVQPAHPQTSSPLEAVVRATPAADAELRVVRYGEPAARTPATRLRGYRRRVSPAGFGPDRPSIGGPTAEDGLRYVAALTGRTPALRDGEHRKLRRRPGLNVEAAAAQLRRDLERRQRRLVRDLVTGGFLTPIEARRLSVRVDVSVHHVDH